MGDFAEARELLETAREHRQGWHCTRAASSRRPSKKERGASAHRRVTSQDSIEFRLDRRLREENRVKTGIEAILAHTITFGRYAGRTFGWIGRCRPQYLDWLIEHRKNSPAFHRTLLRVRDHFRQLRAGDPG